MNPVAIFFLALFGVSLTLGFFFVRAIGRDWAITMFGTFIRAANPVGYWFWWVYYYVSMAFIAVLLVGIIFGLS